MDTVDRLIDRYGPSIVREAAAPLVSPQRAERIERALDNRLTSVSVVLENLHDPHNGAAAIRSVEACGLTSLSVIEGTEPFGFAAGVTIGCEKWVSIERYPTVAPCADVLHRRGFTLYAAVPGAGVALDSIEVKTPIAVVIGNEHEGLTADAIEACDDRFSIPMHGFTQSFNLSVSVALCVYNLANRRRAALGSPGDLDNQERARLRARWYALGIRGVETLVERYVSKLPQEIVSKSTRPTEKP